MNKDAFYFPHFSNARHDRKIRRIRKQLGIEGYAIYFMILEVLREQEGFKYPLDDIDLLADDFGTSEEKVKTVINNYNLFKKDEENFFSFKFNEYLKPYLQVKQNRRIAGIKGNLIKYKYRTKEQLDGLSDFEIIDLNNKRDTLAIAQPSQSDRNASQSKEKESKEKESKVEESKELKELADKSAESEFLKSKFEIFWKNYGKSKEKKVTFEKFKKLSPEIIELAIFKAKEQADKIEMRFRKDPKRWLAGECWNDVIISDSQNKTPTISEQWEGKGLNEKYDWQLEEGYEEAEFEPLPELKK